MLLFVLDLDMVAAVGLFAKQIAAPSARDNLFNDIRDLLSRQTWRV